MKQTLLDISADLTVMFDLATAQIGESRYQFFYPKWVSMGCGSAQSFDYSSSLRSPICELDRVSMRGDP